MAEITSLIITYEGNNTWSFHDSNMPSGATAGSDANSGTWNGDFVTFKTKTGGIIYNGIPYDIIEYVDSTDSGNDFTPTSAKGLIVALAGLGFFNSSGSGGGSPSTFTSLSDTFPNYFGRGDQLVKVSTDETKLTTVPYTPVDRSTDLLDMPSTLIPNQLIKVNASGTGYIFVNPSTLVAFAPAFGMNPIAKGYQWLTIDGVLQPVPNTQNLDQIGDFYSGTVYIDPEQPELGVINIPFSRYKGGDRNYASSFQYNCHNDVAFTTDPDYINKQCNDTLYIVVASDGDGFQNDILIGTNVYMISSSLTGNVMDDGFTFDSVTGTISDFGVATGDKFTVFYTKL